MTIIRELRIPVNMTLDEIHRGGIYTVVELSKQATKGNTGVEILENRPYEDPVRGNGVYTHKILHIGEKVPRILHAILPEYAFKLDEKSWNAFPYCKTVVTNSFLGERFEVILESMHLENDRGETENALSLSPRQLKERQVDFMDMSQKSTDPNPVYEASDPTNFKSEKTARGPLTEGWQKTCDPVSCVYKVITIKFEVFGLQTRTEEFIASNQRDLILRFFQNMFCSIDQWCELSIAELREMEERVKEDLERRLDELNLKTRDQKRIQGEDHKLLTKVAMVEALPGLNDSPTSVSQSNEGDLPVGSPPNSRLEYQIGQLFGVVQASRENTNGDTGVEIITNEPFSNERGAGQYTHKVYHLGSKVPSIVAAMLPSSSLMLVEKAWNAYPSCRTEFHNPWLKERFAVIVESLHLPDSGETDNAFHLSPEELEQRQVIWVDIANDKVKDNPPHREPANFRSEKADRGPFVGKEWWKDHKPVMCCYKLATLKFQVWGFQTRVEDLILKSQTELITKFHKELVCSMDNWYGLTMSDIRILEDEVKRELEEKMTELGMVPANLRSSNSIHSAPV